MSLKYLAMYFVVIFFMLVLNNIKKNEREKSELSYEILIDEESNENYYKELDKLDSQTLKISNEILVLQHEKIK